MSVVSKSNVNPSITISNKNISLEVTLPSGAVVTVTGDFNALSEAVDLLVQVKKEPVTSPEVPPAPLAKEPAPTHVHGPFADALRDFPLPNPSGSVTKIPGFPNPPKKPAAKPATKSMPFTATGITVGISEPPITYDWAEPIAKKAVDLLTSGKGGIDKLVKIYGQEIQEIPGRCIPVHGPCHKTFTDHVRRYVATLNNDKLSVTVGRDFTTYINLVYETPEPASTIEPASAKKVKSKKAKGTLPASTVETEKKLVPVSNSFSALSEPTEEIPRLSKPTEEIPWPKASDLDWAAQDTDSDDSDSDSEEA